MSFFQEWIQFNLVLIKYNQKATYCNIQNNYKKKKRVSKILLSSERVYPSPRVSSYFTFPLTFLYLIQTCYL